jgi:hypothetical protein
MPVIIGRRELIGPDRPFQRYPSDLVCPWAPSSRQPNMAISETVRPEGNGAARQCLLFAVRPEGANHQ